MNFVNNTIDMDCLQEAIILGIDVIIFGFCLRSYRNYKNTVGALKVIIASCYIGFLAFLPTLLHRSMKFIWFLMRIRKHLS